MMEVAKWSLLGGLVSAVLATTFRGLPLERAKRKQMVGRVAVLVVLVATCWALVHLGPNDVLHMTPASLLRVVGVHALILALWSVAVLGLLLLRDAEFRARRVLEMDRALVEAKHRALVSQVNPHFLFNALNSLRALVDEDPARAREMITGLSDVLRRGLQAEPTAMVWFGDELDAAEAYLSVEKVRFEERLIVAVTVTDQAREVMLPALLLQPLVENAITHGRGQPLRVSLDASCTGDRLRVTVANSGTLGETRNEAVTHARQSIGLANVRERLALIYGDRASFTIREAQGAVLAELLLPKAHRSRVVPASAPETHSI